MLSPSPAPQENLRSTSADSPDRIRQHHCRSDEEFATRGAGTRCRLSAKEDRLAGLAAGPAAGCLIPGNDLFPEVLLVLEENAPDFWGCVLERP